MGVHDGSDLRIAPHQLGVDGELVRDPILRRDIDRSTIEVDAPDVRGPSPRETLIVLTPTPDEELRCRDAERDVPEGSVDELTGSENPACRRHRAAATAVIDRVVRRSSPIGRLNVSAAPIGRTLGSPIPGPSRDVPADRVSGAEASVSVGFPGQHRGLPPEGLQGDRRRTPGAADPRTALRRHHAVDVGRRLDPGPCRTAPRGQGPHPNDHRGRGRRVQRQRAGFQYRGWEHPPGARLGRLIPLGSLLSAVSFVVLPRFSDPFVLGAVMALNGLGFALVSTGGLVAIFAARAD